MVFYADHFETSPRLESCDLRNCRHFRELLGGSAQLCPTQITSRPRRAWAHETNDQRAGRKGKEGRGDGKKERLLEKRGLLKASWMRRCERGWPTTTAQI